MGSRNLVVVGVVILTLVLIVFAVISCGSDSREDEKEPRAYTTG
jgi:hypothetical protein